MKDKYNKHLDIIRDNLEKIWQNFCHKIVQPPFTDTELEWGRVSYYMGIATILKKIEFMIDTEPDIPKKRLLEIIQKYKDEAKAARN